MVSPTGRRISLELLTNNSALFVHTKDVNWVGPKTFFVGRKWLGIHIVCVCDTNDWAFFVCGDAGDTHQRTYAHTKNPCGQEKLCFVRAQMKRQCFGWFNQPPPKWSNQIPFMYFFFYLFAPVYTLFASSMDLIRTDTAKVPHTFLCVCDELKAIKWSHWMIGKVLCKTKFLHTLEILFTRSNGWKWWPKRISCTLSTLLYVCLEAQTSRMYIWCGHNFAP